MGVNFSPFEIGRRALRANQFGIAVTGQNIANVNTPGYSRQSVQLSATVSDGTNLRLTGVGVTIDGVRISRDKLIEARLQTEVGIEGRLNAERQALAPLEAAFNDAQGAGGIRQALVGFFGAFGDLEAHPTSSALRATAIERANSLSSAFSSTRARLVQVRTDANKQIIANVEEANSLGKEIAELNVAISHTQNTGGSASELIDRRSESARRLAELTGARSVEADDGSLTITLGDGRAMVLGSFASELTAVPTPPDGIAAISVDGNPAIIADGRIRGLIDGSSEVNNQIQTLDAFASSVATRVNALHSSGSDLDGNPGGVFFEVPGGGAPFSAANLQVAAAVKANPRRVVVGAAGAGTGDATIGRQIFGLLSDPNSVAGPHSGSYSSIYAAIVSDVGDKVRNNANSLTTQQAIIEQTTAQRDSVSGVSLDEEAINLLHYQRAYEAAAKFLKIADEMTQTILALG